MPKVLFLTDRGERMQRSAIKSAPADLEVIMKRRPSMSDLLPLLPTIDFLISERNIPVTGEMINMADSLKLIVRLGSLSYDIDRDTARAIGIKVSMQPVLGTIFAAEHLLMMILAVLKRLERSLNAAVSADHGQTGRRTDENTFAFNWLGYSDINGLFNKSVAVIGMGEIGVELVRRLRSFRVSSIGYFKREQYPRALERELGITYLSLNEAIGADVVISLMPYSNRTDRIINANLIAQMKPSAVLIHAGSGSVIDEQALVEALKAGKIAGAALDTYEFEPLQPTHSLVRLARDPRSNLLLTPHVASAPMTDNRADDYGEILRFMKREPLLYELH
jgi:phosphoglycerate dehydrogenase-like enzyme